MDKCLLKKLIAECIGTFVLVFVACGVAVWTDGDVVATSLAFGLVIVAMAYSIGNISGCHINPAVSLAMAIRKKISWKEFALYVAAQFVGAIIGALLLGIILKNFADNANLKLFHSLGGNEIQGSLKVVKNGELKLNAMSYVGAFLVEVILTFVFIIAILGVTDGKFHDGKHAGLVIGLTLTLVHLFGMGFTGTSVNPARSFAPALFQFFGKNKDSFKQVWIWLAAPMAGSALAAFVYSFFTNDSKCECKCEKKAEAKVEDVKAEEVKTEEPKAEANVSDTKEAE